MPDKDDPPIDDKNDEDETEKQTQEPEAPAQQPAQEQPEAQKKAENAGSDAQPDIEQTVKQLLEPFKATLEDQNRRSAPKIREVLTALYEGDSSILNPGDPFYEIRRQLAVRLGVSKALVDKEREKVLQVIDKDTSDAPQFPTGPKVTKPVTGPAVSPPAAGSSSGAPFGGPAHSEGTPPTGSSQEPPDEPMVWDTKKAGRIMSLAINMPGWMLEEWPRVTPEEEKELGTSFKQIFEEYLPTTKKTGNLLFVLASLEQILKPRALAVMNHRLKKMPVDEARGKAMHEIKQYYGGEKNVGT